MTMRAAGLLTLTKGGGSAKTDEGFDLANTATANAWNVSMKDEPENGGIVVQQSQSWRRA